MAYFSFKGSCKEGGGVIGGMPGDSPEKVHQTVIKQFPSLVNLEIRLVENNFKQPQLKLDIDKQIRAN